MKIIQIDVITGDKKEINLTPEEILAIATPPSLTAEQVFEAIKFSLQKRLDDFARSRGYDGIMSACTYAGSTVPKFAAEGRRALDLRDATWSTAYALLAAVQAGTRPMPASLADIEADFPVLEWPV